MADRRRASPLSVRLSPEDHDWLAALAQREGTSPQVLVGRALRVFRFWQAHEDIVETVLTAAYFLREYRKQAERHRYLQCEYRMQARRMHNQRRAYQKLLWNERNLRRVYEKRLWNERNLLRACEKRLCNERNLRRAYESQLHRQRDYYERQASAATEATPEAPYSPTVAKLLALAVCSASDGEAKAAFTKARTLYRNRVLSHAKCWAGQGPRGAPESTIRACLGAILVVSVQARVVGPVFVSVVRRLVAGGDLLRGHRYPGQ